MNRPPDRSCRIDTERLTLRPTGAADADRAFEIQSDWQVTRMLSQALFPPDRSEIGAWFDGHADEWSAGRAYRFAVERHGRMVGMVDIDDVRDGQGAFGYWFERASWGQGHGLEAARAVVRFAFAEAGLAMLRAGHAADNTASQRLLLKLGFRPVGTFPRMSRSRGETITQVRYTLAGSQPSGRSSRKT